MNKTTFFKGGKHHSSMREGAVLREDAVYQGRELFFGRADAVHQRGREDIFHQQGTEALSIDGGMSFVDEGQRTPFIEEREDGVY